MPILLSGRELATRLNVTYENVMFWQRTGVIPAIQIGNRRFVFNLAVVVEALRKHQESTVEAGATENELACA
jgi:predicted site-specific integrase-resolvase